MARIWIGGKRRREDIIRAQRGKSQPIEVIGGLHGGERFGSTFDCLLRSLWSSGKSSVQLLRRLRTARAESSPTRACGATTESSTPESPVVVWLGPAEPGRAVSILPLPSSASCKEGLEVVRRICRERQCPDDLPELWKDVLTPPESSRIALMSQTHWTALSLAPANGHCRNRRARIK
jgi:hypothetical protein